ncbi:unnamed protein product [Closterium sp. Yama58-4]|nr:unnamed protein product [Closterium sp. Yama58-4]
MSAALPIHQTPSATTCISAVSSALVGLRALLSPGPESLPSGATARAAYATVAVSRDPQFATLEDADVEHFKGILGERGVITDPDAVAAANVDWMGKYKGYSKLLLRPTTTSHVADVLKYCNERRLAVVPQGGNTGLVGGSVPVFDEVSAVDMSCQIGGNVSTNAGGIRLLRYGSLHGSVLGLEVVMADGTVVDMTRALRKDNTGYDLKQLFIGAEGTLGVVTRVVLLAPPRSPSVHVALLGCSSFDAVQQVFCASRRHLGEVLSAAEFFDRSSLQMVLKHNEGTRDPLPDGEYPFYVLIETSGSNPEHDRAKLDTFLEGVMEEGAVEDGTVAHDSTQAAAIWHLREGVAEALQRAGAVYKYDLSVPVSQLYGLVDEMRTRLEGSAAQVVGYGHLGDGNLHLNVSAPSYDDKLLERIEPYVYEWVAGRQGSVSAEHGLGLMKANAIHYSKDPQAVAVMKRVKALFDPNGILNPYKLLPSA